MKNTKKLLKRALVVAALSSLIAAGLAIACPQWAVDCIQAGGTPVYTNRQTAEGYCMYPMYKKLNLPKPQYRTMLKKVVK